MVFLPFGGLCRACLAGLNKQASHLCLPAHFCQTSRNSISLRFPAVTHLLSSLTAELESD